MDIWIWYIWAAWNLVVFAIFGEDKRRSVKGLWRISEKTLIVCAFLMGAAGALVGMRVFRHKTKKFLFGVCIGFAFLVNLGILILLKGM